jgi:hypothetical protein
MTSELTPPVETDHRDETVVFTIPSPDRDPIELLNITTQAHLTRIFESEISPEDGVLMDYFAGHPLHKLTFQYALLKGSVNKTLPSTPFQEGSRTGMRTVVVYQGLTGPGDDALWQTGRTPNSTIQQYEAGISQIFKIANEALTDLGITNLFPE